MSCVYLKGKNVDRFSHSGTIYALLPDPPDKVLGAKPETLLAPLFKVNAAHKDKLKSVEFYVWAIRMAFRHYNCPVRKARNPQDRAVTWAIQEVKRLMSMHVSGRPDVLGSWIRLDPMLYPEEMRPVEKSISGEKDNADT